MKRAARPEADLLYLAPAVSITPADSPSADVIWHELLGYCARAAASHGIQRIFASSPIGCREETCLRSAGFSLYTLETLYRLALPPPAQAHNSGPGFRQQLPQDSWALQRLYMGSTPKLVQQAEGALTGEVGSPMLSWWEPGSWRGVVWEPAGEARGAVQVHLGRAGHWLRVWGTNEIAARDLRALLAQGLRQVELAGGGRRPLPIYAAVRDYEAGLGAALTGFGFAPLMDRARFVKHTVAVVREPLPLPLSAREARQEVPVRMRSQRPGH